MSVTLLHNENLGQKLLKKGFRLYLFSFLIAPSGYIIKVFISNSVSVEDLGLLYSIIGFITLLNIYNDLGLTESLQYFLPRRRTQKQFNNIKTALFISIFVQFLSTLFIIILLIYGAPWLSEHYFHSSKSEDILYLFCYYFIGINIFQTFQSIYLAFQDTYNSQLIDFVRMRSIVIIVLCIFFFSEHTIIGYSRGWVGGIGLSCLVSIGIFIKKYKSSLFQGKLTRDKPMIHEYGKYALWSFFGLNAAQLFGSLIQQITIYQLGAEQAGYYTNFLSLFGLAGIILGPIMSLIFPVVSELMSKNNIHALSKLCSFFYNYFLVFSAAIAGFVGSLGPEIASVIFGYKFISSGYLLTLGSPVLIANMLLVFTLFVLAGIGEIKTKIKLLFIAIIITLVTCLSTIQTLGIYSAILGFCVGQFVLSLLCFIALRRTISISFQRERIGKNTFLILLLSFATVFYKNTFFILNDYSRYNNITYIIIFGLVFFGIFTIFNIDKLLLLLKEIKKYKNN